MLGDVGLGALVLVAYFLSRKRYGDVFTPLFVYVTVWCSCLFLFRLRFINYDELELGTILVIAVSMLAFALGCLVAGKPKNSEPFSAQISLPRLERAIRILNCLDFAGLFFFLLLSARVFGISAFFNDPTIIRLDYPDLGRFGSLWLLLLANYPLFICSVIHLLTSKKFRWFTAIGLFLPIVQGFLMMSRNTFAVPLISGAFVWLYYHGSRALSRRVLSGCALALVFVGLYFVGVGFWYGKLASSPDYSFYKSKDLNVTSQIMLQFIDPYMYATGNFPTLQAAMGDVHGRLWGMRTFFPIARALYAVGFLHDRPENASLEFYFIPIPFNASTYLFSLYEDFGTAGIIIYPFFLGWLGTKLYLRMRAQPTIFILGSTAVLMTAIVYSVFIALASTFTVWYCLVALFMVSRRCAVKSARVRTPIHQPALAHK